MRIIKLVLFPLLCFYYFNNSCFATSPTVAFINPSPKSDKFWQLVTQFSKDAADNLGITLNVHYSENYIAQTTMLASIVNSENKPDYVIFMPFGGSIQTSFDILNNAKIPFVTIGRVYSQTELALIGKPQEKYLYWLGEMYHENVVYGQILANSLVDQALKANKNAQNIPAIGIKGDHYTESREKGKGFRLAVSANKDIKINQIITGNWDRKVSAQRLESAFARHGISKIIWSASDEMALGAIDAIESLGLDAQKFYIGGFDWLPNAIKAVEEGKMKASVGGHFLQGAWSLVRIYDHTLGKKAFIAGDNTDYLKLKLITKENVHKYKVLTNGKNFKAIDYSLFALTNTNNNTYDFDIDKVLIQLNKR